MQGSKPISKNLVVEFYSLDYMQVPKGFMYVIFNVWTKQDKECSTFKWLNNERHGLYTTQHANVPENISQAERIKLVSEHYRTLKNDETKMILQAFPKLEQNESWQRNEYILPTNFFTEE